MGGLEAEPAGPDEGPVAEKKPGTDRKKRSRIIMDSEPAPVPANGTESEAVAAAAATATTEG